MDRVTLKDVAAACGVSRATVSLVLQDSPRVSTLTKERVREAMRRLGYVYDRRAANLRFRRSLTVALVTTDAHNSYFAELTMAIECTLYRHGYTLLLGYSHDGKQRQEKLLHTMLEHRVDGVILVPSCETTAELVEQSLDAAGTPYVLVTRPLPGHAADYVGIDSVAAGGLIGEHLASRGHRRIAFLGGPSQATTRLEREQGLQRALAAHGVEFDPALSIATSADREGGARAAHLLLRTGEVPDAIVCYSDVVAFGVLAALRIAGIEPGTDVAVSSFDDTPEARLQQPPLTSVSTHPGRTGTLAAELLLRRLEDPGHPSETVLLKPELHVRESTANLRLTREQSLRRARGGPHR
jgi:LacI family transcriptional regulator